MYLAGPGVPHTLQIYRVLPRQGCAEVFVLDNRRDSFSSGLSTKSLTCLMQTVAAACVPDILQHVLPNHLRSSFDISLNPKPLAFHMC